MRTTTQQREVIAVSRVMIDSAVWDAIVEHYTHLIEPSEDDRKVLMYILDKEYKRMAHDTYMAERRLDALMNK